MQAAVCHGIGDIRVEEVAKPACGPNEISLKVLACAVCGTDLRILNHGHPKVTPPTILGHELVGVIAEIGHEAALAYPGFSVGDRIVMAPGIACRKCDPCIRGRRRACQDMVGVGYQLPGGFAEYLTVPARAACNFLRVPDGTANEYAALMEPLACCVHGQSIAGASLGDTVAVFGAGAIGCMQGELARLSGATKIVMLDPVPNKLELARKVTPSAVAVDLSSEPAHTAIDRETAGAGADVTIVACSSPQAVVDAVGVTKQGGRVLLFAGLPRGNSRVELDANTLHYKELQVFGAFGSTGDDQETALALIAGGSINAEAMVSQVLPLTQIQLAMELMASGKVLKIVVAP